jgi:hypothetical protein
MTESSRDRFSVDLQGLKPALLVCAQRRGVSPSELIRKALAIVVDHLAPSEHARPARDGRRVRISLRLEAEEATALQTAARAAGLSAGDFVTALLAGAFRVTTGERPSDQAAALTASCSVLTSLNRDLRHLTLLLSRGSVEAARQYRDRLGEVDRLVRAHLRLAAAVLADLKHLRKTTSAGAGVGSET